MQLKKIKNYYDQLIRIDRHKNYLWDRIYNLRGEITDYVLVNHNRRNVEKHWKALKVKATKDKVSFRVSYVIHSDNYADNLLSLILAPASAKNEAQFRRCTICKSS